MIGSSGMKLSVCCARADLEFASGGLYRDGILTPVLAGLHDNWAAQCEMWTPALPATFIILRVLWQRPDQVRLLEPNLLLECIHCSGVARPSDARGEQSQWSTPTETTNFEKITTIC